MAAAQAGASTDRAALEALYAATDGANWTNSANWLTDAPLGTWYGVTTDGAGRVTGLALNENGLTGPIPDALGNLGNLEALDLYFNGLTGPVPDVLGRLTNLRLLNLGGNGLTGPIPDVLGRLTNLDFLLLWRNDLTGPIPDALGNLTDLRALDFGGNDLTGPIPDFLGRLTDLEWLLLGRNGLTGPIPDALGNLTDLRVLSLDRIDLAGPIPDFLGRLTNLELLLLGGSSLTGPIPDALGNLTNLEWLLLDDNDLTGPVPEALGRLTNLERLDLGGNRGLSGPLPSGLQLAGSLQYLDISDTGACAPAAWQDWLETIEFIGRRCETPDRDRSALEAFYAATDGANWTNGANWLTDAPLGEWYGVTTDVAGRVTGLALNENGLTGAVPDALGHLTNLERLHLGGNVRLSGPLPPGLRLAESLRYLNISDTGACAPAAWRDWLETIEFTGRWCGDAPAGERSALEALYAATGGANWTDGTNWLTDAPLGEWYGVTTDVAGRVTRLELDENGLTGAVPDALGLLTNLEWLDLGGNGLTGAIPDVLGLLTNLELLYLDENGLTGPIPDALGRLTNLRWLLLHSNELTGSIPEALGNLTNLRWLYLWGNVLTGAVPDFLGRLTNLEYVALSRNELTGSIPEALGNLTNLQWLFLNDNELTGAVPDFLGRLTNLERLYLGGNGLTGAVPDFLGNLTKLEELSLGRNELTGSIPEALGRLTNLRYLSFTGNGLTGAVPDFLGGLTNLERLALGGNGLTGAVPDFLGDLTNLEELYLWGNDLTGAVPEALGNLTNLEQLHLNGNWGLSGPLPSGLRSAGSLERLDVIVTRACAPAALRDWLATIEFTGRPCGDEPVTVDVAVVYTPAAREAAGGTAAIETLIDLMVAETNQAYAASGVRHRVALAGRAEVHYAEDGDSGVDLARLADPSDGHMDEAHTLRDQVGADLVHLIVDTDKANVGGIAYLVGAFGLTVHLGGGGTFAHELGHNLGLEHDRWQVHHNEGGARTYPAHGYVNQRAFAAGAPPSSRWRTVMAYGVQCGDADIFCSRLLRFSNPRQRYEGDPLGVPYAAGAGATGVAGAADAAAVLDATGPAVALWRDRVARSNRPPVVVGALPDVALGLGGVSEVDVSRAFGDTDGDALAWTVSSSAPQVVAVAASGARVVLTALGAGEATVRVTATDPGGLSAAQAFAVTVSDQPASFTDHPIRPGVTPVRTIHFAELRARIDVLRQAAGLGRFPWTDPVLTAGVTPVRLVHLLELREALGAAYAAAGRPAPPWTDAAPAAGATPVRAAHVTELRAAVTALE